MPRPQDWLDDEDRHSERLEQLAEEAEVEEEEDCGITEDDLLDPKTRKPCR